VLFAAFGAVLAAVSGTLVQQDVHNALTAANSVEYARQYKDMFYDYCVTTRDQAANPSVPGFSVVKQAVWTSFMGSAFGDFSTTQAGSQSSVNRPQGVNVDFLTAKVDLVKYYPSAVEIISASKSGTDVQSAWKWCDVEDAQLEAKLMKKSGSAYVDAAVNCVPAQNQLYCNPGVTQASWGSLGDATYKIAARDSIDSKETLSINCFIVSGGGSAVTMSTSC
jgi:hypothetical protein